MAGQAFVGRRNCGPTFGGGCDFYVADNWADGSGSNPHTYDFSGVAGQPDAILAGARNFRVHEVEVFLVLFG